MSPDEQQPTSSGSASATSRPVVARGTTGGQRLARGAQRTLLYLYVIAATAVLVILIALIVANRGAVNVSWVFGSSSVSLVWLVLGAALLGLLAPPAGAVPPLQTVSGTWSWVVTESNTQAAEPAAITVANNTNIVDADTSSLEALRSNPGPEGISLREAIEATNNDPGSYAIAFSAALSGTTITLGKYLPPLTGGGVSIEGDIDGDGTPDVTLVTTLQEQWSRAIQIASSGNRLHGLTLKGFAVGVWIDPAIGDELPTHQTLADNVVSGLAILGFGADGIYIHSPASPDCGLPMPDPCRTYITFANTTITGNTIETIPARGAGEASWPQPWAERLSAARAADQRAALSIDGPPP